MNSLNDSEKVAEEEHLSCTSRPDKKRDETIKAVPVYPNDPLGYKKYVQDDTEEKHGEFQKLDPTASPVKDQYIACSLLESGLCVLEGSIPANVAARGPHDEPPPIGRGQATTSRDAAIVPGIVPRAEPLDQKLPHAESHGNHSRVMAMRKITAIVNTIDLCIQINVRAQRSLRGG